MMMESHEDFQVKEGQSFRIKAGEYLLDFGYGLKLVEWKWNRSQPTVNSLPSSTNSPLVNPIPTTNFWDLERLLSENHRFFSNKKYLSSLHVDHHLSLGRLTITDLEGK